MAQTPSGKALLALSAPFREEFDSSFERDRIRGVPSPKARVRLYVRDVGAEATVAQHDRFSARRVRSELLEWPARGSTAASAPWGLREQRLRFVERHGEELLLVLERAGLGPLLDVGAVAAILCRHLLALDLSDDPWERQQTQRLLERARLRGHRREQRCGVRLLVGVLGNALGHVRT